MQHVQCRTVWDNNWAADGSLQRPLSCWQVWVDIGSCVPRVHGCVLCRVRVSGRIDTLDCIAVWCWDVQ